MSIGMIALLALGLAGALVAVLVLLGVRLPGTGEDPGMRSSVKNIVSAQRNVGPARPTARGDNRKSIFESAAESGEQKRKDSRLTLEKKLKYAQWKISPIAFRGLEIGIGAVAVILAYPRFNMVITTVSATVGTIIMRWLLNTKVERRFARFDADFAPFLLSLVGLLKTGMNAMQAIEAAAQGMDESSMVRQEVDLMTERLRFGVSEDRSIGSFGEEVYHPEIELFVQALLLSRRVGGNLSDTLDRLARQVRKRQHFRSSAKAAVGLQRGSIWFILGIMVSMELYLLVVFPEAVLKSLADPVGWQVWQGGIMSIMLGIFWIRQVTKLKL